MTPVALDELRADCPRCSALCCVAPAFAASADFAINKPAGQPCPNLQEDFRCGIHDRLRQQGFPGCAAYDCFGAGQKITQHTFHGQDWRRSPRLAGQIFDAFAIMRGLHELLWYLSEALKLATDDELDARLGRARDKIDRLSNLGPTELAEVDVPALRREVDPLLVRVSELTRAGVRRRALDRGGADLRGKVRGTGLAGADLRGGNPAGADLRGGNPAGADLYGADLAGANLRGADLAGADLRGALLIGANLRHTDLRSADLRGADLRGTDLAGADLTGSIFLNQAQLDAAGGDRTTRLPASLRRPAHWPV
jgi:uncharacterized protein YjbI with pentapeptide repeats